MMQVQNQPVLKVCIMSADFWGLKSAGGTATAYHLLAAVLSKNPAIKVCQSGLKSNAVGSFVSPYLP